MLTNNQLLLIVDWIEASFERAALPAEDRWKADEAVYNAKIDMYEAFGFVEGPTGGPMLPEFQPNAVPITRAQPAPAHDIRICPCSSCEAWRDDNVRPPKGV